MLKYFKFFNIILGFQRTPNLECLIETHYNVIKS